MLPRAGADCQYYAPRTGPATYAAQPGRKGQAAAAIPTEGDAAAAHPAQGSGGAISRLATRPGRQDCAAKRDGRTVCQLPAVCGLARMRFGRMGVFGAALV